MVISQGEVWWADLPAPVGSGPGFRRPVAGGRLEPQPDRHRRVRAAETAARPRQDLRWRLALSTIPAIALARSAQVDGSGEALEDSLTFTVSEPELSEKMSSLIPI